MAKQAILVYVTVPSQEAAVELGRELLKRRLIACVNILGPTQSLYSWRGQIEEQAEFVLWLKTRASLFTKLKSAISELHPYECPCILSFEVADAHPPYLEWIFEETTE